MPLSEETDGGNFLSLHLLLSRKTDVTRTADEAGQSIACDYDAFGNLTAVRIGGLLLASYQYAAKNGQLTKQVYGNGQEVTFTYDRLGRTSTASYSGGRTLTYAYNGDGQLYSIRDDAGTESTADDVTYFYTYDSLKRAIACQMCRGVEQVLSVRWEYDDSSRIKTQAWQMGQQSYSESYTYSAKDGSLTSVSMNGGSLQLGYDALSRLSTAGNGVYTRNYTYRDISGSQTTTQVEKLRYTGLNGALSGLTYNYTYNPLGNIASVTSGSSTSSYTYDAMGQLTAASLPGMQYAYTYDGAGNLQTVTRGETTNTYTYGNASWKDLLTAFNGEKIVYEGQTMDEDDNVTGTPVSGNPIRYYNGTPWNFSWAEGRSLKTAESSTPEQDISLEFSYDADGLRIEKHVTKTVYEMTADHTYTDTVVAPTCTEAGYTLHECECGYSYTDTEVEALGHNYLRDSDGDYVCTRCSDVHQHSYTDTVVAPTCTEAGYTLHDCACGYSYRDTEVEALGHNYVENEIDIFTCTRCGDSYQQHTHRYTTSRVVSPTCLDAGYTVHTCACGDSYEDTPTPALGHSYSNTVVAPTCTESGYTIHTCTRCEDTYHDTITEALGHDYTETVVAPTCTERGYTRNTCTRCDNVTLTDYHLALDHDYIAGETVEPTCTEQGYTRGTCSRCGKTGKINIVDALGHDFPSVDLGQISRCTRCGKSFSEVAPPSSGRIDPTIRPSDPTTPIVDMDLEEPTEPVDAAQLLHRGAATEIEEIHQYIYAGGKLLRETITEGETTRTLDFVYDNAGNPYRLIYSDDTTTSTYYYITNLQGDVMYLVDSSGNEVAAYDYDPYGKVINITGALAEINPLRYRGYYYDSDTGFYYLLSRYYDPKICRFINADGYASTGHGLAGFNMFAYCNNSPIIYRDSDGDEPVETIDIDGDGEPECYVYEYTFELPVLIVFTAPVITETKTGKLYTYKFASADEMNASKDLIQKTTGPYDFVITDCSEPNDANPNLQVRDSYRVKSNSQMYAIIDSLLEYGANYKPNWRRTKESLYVEWREHNRYAIFSSSARDVDFDNAEEGYTARDFLRKAIRRVLPF